MISHRRGSLGLLREAVVSLQDIDREILAEVVREALIRGHIRVAEDADRVVLLGVDQVETSIGRETDILSPMG